MNVPNSRLWTIEELSANVALALSVDYAGQGNGRVRDVPDSRTIRYYVTLGLVDRPAAMRGRTALYGRRHLLQLVAIKRLQATGLALVELQRTLVGLTDAELAPIAKVGEPSAPSGTEPRQTRRSPAFWTESPAPIVKRDPVEVASQLPLHGVELTKNVTMLLRPARPLEPDDIEAIRAVAGPLLKLLEMRRLTTNH